jgi:uncharacterized protein YciU (UPF0263 family)
VRLHRKYAGYVEKSRMENKPEMYVEIKRIIEYLQNQNNFISDNAVRKMLSRNRNDKNFKKVFKEISKNLSF